MVSVSLEQAAASIRYYCTEKWARQVLGGAIPPIRGMARLVREAQELLLQECLQRGLPRPEAGHIVATNIVDRTIGDVDVRAITEKGYTDLAEQMGITIPGERGARGEPYERLRHRM
jgi:hypothetical protein